MQPLQADLAGAAGGGLEGQGVDLRRGQQSMGVEQAQDLKLPGPDADPHHVLGECQGPRAWRRRWICPGSAPTGIDSARIGNARVAGMVQTPDLPGLGPNGNLQLADWRR